MGDYVNFTKEDLLKIEDPEILAFIRDNRKINGTVKLLSPYNSASNFEDYEDKLLLALIDTGKLDHVPDLEDLFENVTYESVELNASEHDDYKNIDYEIAEVHSDEHDDNGEDLEKLLETIGARDDEHDDDELDDDELDDDDHDDEHDDDDHDDEY